MTHCVALILLGAGDSNRFKKYKVPKKQWLRVGDIPLWLKVAQEVSNYYPFSKLILSAKEEELQYMQEYLDSLELNFILTKGGSTRQESLQNALMEVKEEYVLVSDIARCNTPQKVFQNILEQIKNFDCVVPFLNIPDTIAYADDKTLQYLKRENLKIIQTPQLSKTNILKQALQKGNFTDESSAIANFGGSIGFVQGSPKARKITFIDDLDSMQLPPPSTKTIIGNGSDIHALKSGNGIILGGISIPCDFELIAHSDGDVCLHAISDAILGGIGAGDIGEWFPDNNNAYKNADSALLLKKIVDFSINVGYQITQADITIFAQKPKLSPYKNAMEKRISEILEIPLFSVNVKATTTEHLGFIGRGEGIMVQATLTLTYFNWKNYHFK